MPVPTVTSMTCSWPRAAPSMVSAQAVAFASFSTTTGRPIVVLDPLPQRLVAPGEVGREQHAGPGLVDEPGGAEADGVDLVPAGSSVTVSPITLRRQLRAGRRRGPLQLLDDAAVLIHHPGGDLGAPDVNPDRQAHGPALPPARPRPGAGRSGNRSAGSGVGRVPAHDPPRWPIDMRPRTRAWPPARPRRPRRSRRPAARPAPGADPPDPAGGAAHRAPGSTRAPRPADRAAARWWPPSQTSARAARPSVAALPVSDLARVAGAGPAQPSAGIRRSASRPASRPRAASRPGPRVTPRLGAPAHGPIATRPRPASPAPKHGRILPRTSRPHGRASPAGSATAGNRRSGPVPLPESAPGACSSRSPDASARFLRPFSAVSMIVFSALRLSIPGIGIRTPTASS